jgi:hypothetical protein
MKMGKRHIVEKTECRTQNKKNTATKHAIALAIIAVLLSLFNQAQLSDVSRFLASGSTTSSQDAYSVAKRNLANIHLDELQSTGHTIAAVFPVEDIKTTQDAIALLFPSGTPDYGGKLGVSYDDAVGSLEKLARMYPLLKTEVKQNNPAAWRRFMNLASKPLGISCEYCCGIRAIGINSKGDSACGCQHNPALLSVALYLSAYTNYTDGEILREVMRWKTLFFPKDMIKLGTDVAAVGASSLDKLPSMVGGC